MVESTSRITTPYYLRCRTVTSLEKSESKVPMLLKVQQLTPVYYDDDDSAEVQDAKQPDMEYLANCGLNYERDDDE